MRLTLLIAASVACLAMFGPVSAQGLFSPHVLVNNLAVTNYEIEQRRAFLEILRAPGDLDKLAEKQLIEDRLKQEAAAQMGISLTPEQIATGLTDFAKQANLTSDEFIAELEKAGVAAQTFRDFVTSGLLWRDVIRAKFAPRTTITKADVDRALSVSSHRAKLRVLLSELVLPATPDVAEANSQLATELSRSLHGGADFAAAARKYSVSSTGPTGGKLNWLALDKLPPALVPMFEKMRPGDISQPVALPNAIALFEMRGLSEDTSLPASEVTVDYAQFLIPGGRSEAALAEAAKVQAKLQSCDDLYPLARDLPANRLLRTSEPLPKVPRNVALELAGMNPDQTSTALTRGDDLVLLMLCSRTLTTPKPVDRDAVRNALLNARLAQKADIYLAKLKAAAYIRRP